MSRTNDEWEALIEAKTAEVVADSSLTNYAPGITTADNSFALTIDHTLLKPDATPSQVDTLCDEAIKYGFKVFGRPSLQKAMSPLPHCFLLIYNIYHFLSCLFFCSFLKYPRGPCPTDVWSIRSHGVVGARFNSHAV